MKKLMIAVAAVATCFAANAVNFYWGDTALKALDGSTAVADGSVKAYCFWMGTDSTGYDAAIAYLTGTAAAGFADAHTLDETQQWLYSNFSENTLSIGGKDYAAQTTVGESYGGAVKSKKETTTNGTTYYFAEILEYTEDGDSYYKANVGSYTSTANQKTYADMGTKWLGEAGTKAISWQATDVPEPTSAMLLLLGVAGLALKRRRA